MHKLCAVVILALVGCSAVSPPRPVGVPGPAADALANAMLERIDIKAWENTRAVTWNFGGRRTHLWDRERMYDLYKKEDREVLLRINDKTGIARDKGQPLAGVELDKALNEAWEAWVNDSFWLNAPSKCFDEGTERSIVHDDEGDHLLVAYSSGGVTPGDAYLWDIKDGLPVHWKMWTKILPVGGVNTTWENWEKLSTGAWIATKHEFTARSLPITELRGTASLAELAPGPDPFAALE